MMESKFNKPNIASGLWALLLSCTLAYQPFAKADSLVAKTLRDSNIPDFPPPGKLVDIGGRKIQIDCRGRGKPTVVLESGLGTSGSLDWSFVHDQIAKTTRTCAYSRAGIMWSDPHDAPEVAQAIAEDLHTTLGKAGEKGLFVLVGHSLGGPYIMTYTKYYGAEVAGLVFVDSSHPDQLWEFEDIVAKYQSTPDHAVKVRPSHKLLTRFNQLQIVFGTVFAYAATSEAASLNEGGALGQTLSEAGTIRQLGDRPTIVLTAGAPLSAEEQAIVGMTPEEYQQFRTGWRLLQADMATWSSNSQQLIVPDAGHHIHIDRPDVVIAAVRSVVGSVRNHRRVNYVDGITWHEENNHGGHQRY
jgi:pimeloyl-ACP methyl ester carboxylesterase